MSAIYIFGIFDASGPVMGETYLGERPFWRVVAAESLEAAKKNWEHKLAYGNYHAELFSVVFTDTPEADLERVFSDFTVSQFIESDGGAFEGCIAYDGSELNDLLMDA